MTDKELLKIVTGFRKGLLGKRPPDRMCVMVSWALESFLRFFHQMDTVLISGKVKVDGEWSEHWWIQLKDKRIIDATASQFNPWNEPRMPEVYIGEKPKHYKKDPA